MKHLVFNWISLAARISMLLLVVEYDLSTTNLWTRCCRAVLLIKFDYAAKTVRAESSSARFNQLRDGARAEGSGETAIYYGRPSPYRGAVSVQCRASGQKRWLIFDCTVASRAGVEGLTKLFVIPIDCGSTQIGIVRREWGKVAGQFFISIARRGDLWSAWRGEWLPVEW